MAMTAEEYIARSNALEREMRRIRENLDRSAESKHKSGIDTDSSDLVRRSHQDMTSVIERIKELEKEFWGCDL